jgi:hypothetical protein
MPASARQPRYRYTVGRCRRCGAFELHRSQARTLIQKLARKFTPLVPLRCPACGSRTLRLAAAAEARPAPPPVREDVPQLSRRERRRRRRLRRRITAAAWVIGAALTAGTLGYMASLG